MIGSRKLQVVSVRSELRKNWGGAKITNRGGWKSVNVGSCEGLLTIGSVTVRLWAILLQFTEAGYEMKQTHRKVLDKKCVEIKSRNVYRENQQRKP